MNILLKIAVMTANTGQICLIANTEDPNITVQKVSSWGFECIIILLFPKLVERL